MLVGRCMIKQLGCIVLTTGIAMFAAVGAAHAAEEKDSGYIEAALIDDALHKVQANFIGYGHQSDE